MTTSPRAAALPSLTIDPCTTYARPARACAGTDVTSDGTRWAPTWRAGGTDHCSAGNPTNGDGGRAAAPIGASRASSSTVPTDHSACEVFMASPLVAVLGVIAVATRAVKR